MRRTRAFMLIELLVVIAVTGWWVGILLSGVERIKKQRKRHGA